MLLFGHVGLTVGVIKIFEKIVIGKNRTSSNFVDYRVVMVGAILPDIIDKPLIQLIYGLQFHSGHFIAHSFIFSGTLIAIGIFLLIINRTKNVFLLGICCLIHQLFDKLMLLPSILLSTGLGGTSSITRNFEFIHRITSHIYRVAPYKEAVRNYFFEPNVLISEIMGFIIVVYFIGKVYINKGFDKFLKYGEL